MANLPQIEAPAVAPAALRLPEADPNAFGANVGQGLRQLGADVGAVVAAERHRIAANDAADAELKYGTENDKLERQAMEDMKTLNSSDDASYQRLVMQRVTKLTEDRNELRARYESTLSDPLAQKSYNIRTRLQTQAAERQALVVATQHIDTWREKTNDGLSKMYAERATRVTGHPETDILSFSTSLSASHDYFDKANPGMAPAARDLAHQMLDKKIAKSAVGGYEDFDAAMKFMASETHEGVRIGFDPEHPEKPSILSAEETGDLKAQWVEKKATKDRAASNTAGISLALANDTVGYDAMVKLAKKAFPDDPVAAFSAIQHYSTIQGERHAAQDRARQAATEEAQAALLKDPLHFDPTTLDPKKVNVSQLIGQATRTQVYVTRPLVEKVSSVINDPAAAGFSAAIELPKLHDAAVAAGLPTREVQALDRAYRKDAALSGAASKAPDHGKGMSMIDDAVRQALGVSSISGKNLSDLPPGWKQDVWHWSQIEYARRLAAVGEPGKQIPPQQSLQIAADIADEIKNKKEEARKNGKLSMPEYTPKEKVDPTPAQKQAAAALVMALKGGQPEVAAAVHKPGDVIEGVGQYAGRRFQIQADGTTVAEVK